MGQEIGPLDNLLQPTAAGLGWEKPRHFRLGQAADRQALEQLAAQGHIGSVYDQIELAVDELYDIARPEQKDHRDQATYAQFAKGYQPLQDYGEWVYYPWSRDLVHFPPRDDLRALRTSRNRNLITGEEQNRLYQATVAVVGMSVGSNVAEALVSQGIAGKLILIDMDQLEPSNLNRIRAPYRQIGAHKVAAIAQKISEIDPYIEQVHYLDGLDEAVLGEIIKTHQPTVLVDEMDDIRMKLRLRYQAQAAKLPVVMAADDGDNILLDIERYDLHDDLPLLHGKIPEAVIHDILTRDNIPRPELGKMIGQYFVGLENTPLRMFESLVEVGRTLPSWPQLGGAAAMAGIVLAYAMRKIILGQPLAEGRFVVGPDAQLDPQLETDEYRQKLAEFQQRFSA